MLARRGEGLAAPVHGSVLDDELAALGLSPAEIADFSHNSNPFGPLPAVERAARQANLSRYPDPEATALRRAVAEREGLDPEQVICGNGSNELFWLIALAFLQAEDRALVLGPTYGEYERACRIAGARVSELRADGPVFRHVPREIERVVDGERPRVLWLCNPNNPTGVYVELSEIERLVLAHPEVLIVIDESYLAFVAGAQSAAQLLLGQQGRGAENLIVIRSMTKDHALAGVRLAYALAATVHVQGLRRIRPYWNVNAVAQTAGLAAVTCAADLEPPLEQAGAAARHLADALKGLGLDVLPTATNFFLVRVGNATAFRAALLPHGCVVRDCTSFGLPEHVRIAARGQPECDRLIASVGQVLAGNKGAAIAARSSCCVTSHPSGRDPERSSS